MSDIFGIGAAIKGAAEIYFRSARHSGRTTMMLDALKDGDRIIFQTPAECTRVTRLVKERKLDVQCICVPADSHRIFELGTSQGRTIFDHSWLEEHYMSALQDIGKGLADLSEQRLSGSGEPHRETRRQAIEAQKWL